MFRLILIVLLGLATFRLALAEPQQETEPQAAPPVVELPLMIQCANRQMVDGMLMQYGEKPFVEGFANWQIPNGQTLSGRLEIYVNPTTHSYSVIIVLAGDIKCVVISGDKFDPWFPNRKQT